MNDARKMRQNYLCAKNARLRKPIIKKAALTDGFKIRKVKSNKNQK